MLRASPGSGVMSAQESFVDGWQGAMWAGAAVMAALFVYILARGPRQFVVNDDGVEPASDVPDTVIR